MSVEANEFIKNADIKILINGEEVRLIPSEGLGNLLEDYHKAKVKNLGLFNVMPRYLDELAQKHNVDVTKIMIGKVGNDLYVWRYDEGSYERFKTLEIITLNGV